MYKYQYPNFEKTIESIRVEVRRDFAQMEKKFELPQKFHFAAVVKVSQIGMIPVKGYPFIKLHDKFIEHLSSRDVSSEELENSIGLFVSVWNYFPHDDLGMSPHEKMIEDMEKIPQIPKKEIGSGGAFSASVQYKAADERILKLSNIARKSFAVHMKVVRGTDADIDTVINILTNPEEPPNNALMYILKEVCGSKRIKNKLTHEDLQPIIRSLAFCENHIASKMTNGHYNSRMFSNIIQQHVASMAKATDGNNDLDDPLYQFDDLLGTHLSIFRHGKKLGANMQLQESAHHILDWFALIDVKEFLAYEPQDIATLSLAVAHLISKTVDPDFKLGCGTQKIYVHTKGLFDDKSEYTKEVHRLASLVICGCSDPFLMIANLIEVPEDWEEKLRTIAPHLKSHSSGDSKGASIKSPYF